MTTSHESAASELRHNPFAGMTAEEIRGEHSDSNPYPSLQVPTLQVLSEPARTTMARHAHPAGKAHAARYRGAPEYGDGARAEIIDEVVVPLTDDERARSHEGFLAATAALAALRAQKQRAK